MHQTRLTRRQACRILAAAPAALALGAPHLKAAQTEPKGPQKPTPFRLRYILGSSMYGTTKLAEIVPEIRKTGTDFLDVWPKRHADQREQMEAMGHDRFAELLRKHGARLGMLTRYDLGPFKLREEMRVLKSFGGRVVIAGSTGTKATTAAELKAEVKQFVEKMKPHAAVAEELGITIGIENHGHALINSPDSLRFLAELAASPNLGIAMAPYHLPQDEKLLAGLIEELGPKLVHFYAWEHGQGCMKKLPKPQELEQMPGRGPLDFRPLVAALAKIDYRGWTEIFMHPVPRGIPILETTAKVTEEINRARTYLDRLAAQVG